MDVSKLEPCHLHNLPTYYFCDKNCTPGKPYFCQACVDDLKGAHDHRPISRHVICQSLFEEISKNHNQVEKLHADVEENFVPFQDIINHAQSEVERLKIKIEDEQKNLLEDYKNIDKMIELSQNN